MIPPQAQPSVQAPPPPLALALAAVPLPQGRLVVALLAPVELVRLPEPARRAQAIIWLFSYTAGLPAIVAKRSVCEKRESVYSSGMDYMRTIHLGQRLSRLNCPSKLVFAFVGLTKTSNGLQSSFSGSLYVGTVETTIRLDGIISSP